MQTANINIGALCVVHWLGLLALQHSSIFGVASMLSHDQLLVMLQEPEQLRLQRVFGRGAQHPNWLSQLVSLLLCMKPSRLCMPPSDLHGGQ